MTKVQHPRCQGSVVRARRGGRGGAFTVMYEACDREAAMLVSIAEGAAAPSVDCRAEPRRAVDADSVRNRPCARTERPRIRDVRVEVGEHDGRILWLTPRCCQAFAPGRPATSGSRGLGAPDHAPLVHSGGGGDGDRAGRAKAASPWFHAPRSRACDLARRTLAAYRSRIVEIDLVASLRAGAITDRLIAAGRFPGLSDVLIAAIADTRGLGVLTRNHRHFELMGVPVFDPFSTEPPGGLPDAQSVPRQKESSDGLGNAPIQ